VTADWREALLAGATALDARVARRDPCHWPGYDPVQAVRAYRLAGSPNAPGPVAVAWDFTVQGGSFGEDDATVFAAAVRHAVAERVPVVSLVRSGGTRLQEGMAALVGIPRAAIALLSLAEAGLPHLSIADQPTTGGVWIGVVAGADLRAAVKGATVGFAGPRVVEAMTGSLPGLDSHTAASAYAAGLVDALLAPDDVSFWLSRTLAALAPAHRAPDPLSLPARTADDVSGWGQVLRARARTVGGRQLLGQLLEAPVHLQARYDDRTVTAAVGRIAGQAVVGVALASEVARRPTPDGYRLATRAFRLADRLGLPIVSLVDTPGADPSPGSERDGIAPAMAETLQALLTCSTPTLALVHGEGGSGGALAAAAADVVLVTEDAYFAAIGPEGAAAALRLPPEQCADQMRITPHDLLALGFADAFAEASDVPGHLVALLARGPSREDRLRRWSGALPGQL
jgi:acetyl-CoA carboxylase carboxyl transferase subunit beta